MNFSSNIKEVIRAVLNPFSFAFFYKKICHAAKSPKAPKCTKTPRERHETLTANKNKKCS